MLINPDHDVLLECFVKHLFIGACEVSKQVFGGMSICSELLNIGIDRCIERIDVVIEFLDEVECIGNQETDQRWFCFGSNEEDLNQCHEEAWTISNALDVVVGCFGDHAFGYIIIDRPLQALVDLVGCLSIPYLLSNIVKGSIIADMLEGNLTVVREKVSCDGVSGGIISNSDLEDVFPSSLRSAIAMACKKAGRGDS